jgi:hypothetical protein
VAVARECARARARSKNRFACDAIDRARPSQRWKVRLKSDLFGVQFRRGLIIYELLK